MPTHTRHILLTLILNPVLSSALAAGMPALPIAAADLSEKNNIITKRSGPAAMNIERK
jgi:hypothetical protein